MGGRRGKNPTANSARHLSETSGPATEQVSGMSPGRSFTQISLVLFSHAHYTQALQGWQFETVSIEHNDNRNAPISAIEMTGLETHDPLKATRITFFHMLLTWMLGRILLTNGRSRDVMERRGEIVRLGHALGSSKLLFQRGEWWTQLTPNFWFKPGHDWIDETLNCSSEGRRDAQILCGRVDHGRKSPSSFPREERGSLCGARRMRMPWSYLLSGAKCG